jgi:hypothetical protein
MHQEIIDVLMSRRLKRHKITGYSLNRRASSHVKEECCAFRGYRLSWPRNSSPAVTPRAQAKPLRLDNELMPPCDVVKEEWAVEEKITRNEELFRYQLNCFLF